MHGPEELEMSAQHTWFIMINKDTVQFEDVHTNTFSCNILVFHWQVEHRGELFNEEVKTLKIQGIQKSELNDY